MILFRDISCSGALRVPAWLEGCVGLQRVQAEGGDILTTGDALLIPQASAVEWHALPDGWECALHGDPQHHQLIRNRADVVTVPVRDRFGRIWIAPGVLDAANNLQLALRWGKNPDGVRVRVPTLEQAKLIAIVQSARVEMLKDQFASTPLDVLVSWVYPLIESVYHLTGDVLDALGLVDDMLGILVVTAAIGFPKAITDG